MKKLVLILILLSACAKSQDSKSQGACKNSAVLGTWTNSVDTLTLRDDCTGTGSACNSEFTYPNVSSSQGYADVNILKTDSTSGCMPYGVLSCSYYVDESSLELNCGYGVLTYEKQ